MILKGSRRMGTIKIEKKKKPFHQEIHVPGDKSISHRAVMLGALAHGKTKIDGFLPGADCLQTIACFRQLGVEIEQPTPTEVVIEGRGREGFIEPATPLDVGNSGTTIRLLLGILAGTPFHSIILGDQSIAQRPMKRVVEPLRQMGAQIDGRQDGNYPPLSIRGGALKGIHYMSPVASAQVKSCLLLAGLQAEGETTIIEPSLSRDHTERMLRAFGVHLTSASGKVKISGGQILNGQYVRIPGDPSSAAFFWAAALMVPGSSITVRDVGLNPTRTGILDIFQQMGAHVDIQQKEEWCGEPVGDVTVSGEKLRGIEVKGEMIPRLIDEIPLLAVVATQAEGITTIKDAGELKVKETNRIRAMVTELTKLGANIEETEDGMKITGATPLSGGICKSYGDHRIAMSMAIAGLAAQEEVIIQGAEVVNISFPGFYKQLIQLQ